MMGSKYITCITAMSEAEDKIISLRIFMPELLRNEFKAVCARQGRNMSEVVTDFVKKYVAEYGMLPYSADHPSDPQPTEPQPTDPEPAAAKRGKTPTVRGRITKAKKS
jgi:antitoxin component of RelBE/YafQ-DinJ toxin-antitoxin module